MKGPAMVRRIRSGNARGNTLIELIIVIAIMALKHKSLALGAYSVLTWHVTAAGFLLGLWRPRRPTRERIEAVEIVGATMKAPLSRASS